MHVMWHLRDRIAQWAETAAQGFFDAIFLAYFWSDELIYCIQLLQQL